MSKPDEEAQRRRAEELQRIIDQVDDAEPDSEPQNPRDFTERALARERAEEKKKEE